MLRNALLILLILLIAWAAWAFKALGFWLKNKQKNKKKLLHERGSSKLEASRAKNV